MDDDIAKMLERSESSTERATLLVLYKIQQNLVALGEEFKEHRADFIVHRGEFKTHVVDEQKLLNRGLGGWVVMSMVLAAALSVSGWYISKHIIDLNTAQQIAIETNSNRLTALETLTAALRDQHINGAAK